jgi:zinc D-Ala-D-Ala carboxypeptidase
MSSSERKRTTARRARSVIAVLLALAVAATVGAVLGYGVVGTWSSSSPSSPTTSSPVVPVQDGLAADSQGGVRPVPDRHGRPDGNGPPLPPGVTVDDGVVPGGVTVSDDEFPAVANLDPDLLGALRRAAAAATRDGIGLTVTSGWRSAAYQDQLLREAVAEYGSEEEAARWVATAETSLHVSGDAVDIGPSAASAWLSRYGAAYGLCQTYGNEPWHFELHPQAADSGCPTPYADPTHDPRLR